MLTADLCQHVDQPALIRFMNMSKPEPPLLGIPLVTFALAILSLGHMLLLTAGCSTNKAFSVLISFCWKQLFDLMYERYYKKASTRQLIIHQFVQNWRLLESIRFEVTLLLLFKVTPTFVSFENIVLIQPF